MHRNELQSIKNSDFQYDSYTDGTQRLLLTQQRQATYAYVAREKLGPHTLINEPHYRLRTDIVDTKGHVSLRYLGKLRHLNVGWSYRGQRVYLYIIDDEVELVSVDGEIIGQVTLDPERGYHPIRRTK